MKKKKFFRITITILTCFLALITLSINVNNNKTGRGWTDSTINGDTCFEYASEEDKIDESQYLSQYLAEQTGSFCNTCGVYINYLKNLETYKDYGFYVVGKMGKEGLKYFNESGGEDGHLNSQGVRCLYGGTHSDNVIDAGYLDEMLEQFPEVRLKGWDDIYVSSSFVMNYYYYETGKEIKPEVEVKYNGKVISPSTYTVSYDKGDNADFINGGNNYKAIVTFNKESGFLGEVTTTYEVEDFPNGYPSATLSQTEYDYDGSSKKPTVSNVQAMFLSHVTGEYTTVNVSSNDYTVTYDDDTVSAGTHSVTVTLKPSSGGNGSVKLWYSIINKDNPSDGFDTGLTYTGEYGKLADGTEVLQCYDNTYQFMYARSNGQIVKNAKIYADDGYYIADSDGYIGAWYDISTDTTDNTNNNSSNNTNNNTDNNTDNKNSSDNGSSSGNSNASANNNSVSNNEKSSDNKSGYTGTPNTTGTENGHEVYYGNDGKTIKDDTREENGKTYYYDEKGYAAKNTVIDMNGKNYITGSDGAIIKTPGWHVINSSWYYVNNDGTIASNEFIDGYWLNSDGIWTDPTYYVWAENSTGWWFEGGGWYPVSEWYKINGSWYYFDESGYMATNGYCYETGSNWLYWVGSDGARNGLYCWHVDETGWWLGTEDGSWYACNEWAEIDGTWFYFGADGYMLTDQYVDGYWLGSDGACW